ncbi:hypothetical protein SKAU_G00288820 [Synaphobranchus kaupii]|uniref:SAP domain-containing protein n=1 Tax=Synaphobranchus kaupii TaxID=118154 RepID=A0A9Q1ETI7_SYNKA|nr:hypothetical protein SKAU_G00288820 [Synaphobranchus kaupii]
MAELEDITLEGKPLYSLRVADLKSALEQRGLAKSGQKNALIKRLKGALMLENLQRTSTSHMGLQPNSQIGEEMSQNSFIKQYLSKQQELLRQRLEREVREVATADDSPAAPDDGDHTESSDINSCFPEQQCSVGHTPQLAEEVMSAEACVFLPQSSASSASQAHATVGSPAPSPLDPEPPLQAVASLSVRVLAGPPSPPQSGPPLSQSAQDDSDEEWGVGAGPRRAGWSQPIWERSRRKQQPPQHIPPQLKQPTPPPSFPLPDTPKQSPRGPDHPQGVAGGRDGSSSAESECGGGLRQLEEEELPQN